MVAVPRMLTHVATSGAMFGGAGAYLPACVSPAPTYVTPFWQHGLLPPFAPEVRASMDAAAAINLSQPLIATASVGTMHRTASPPMVPAKAIGRDGKTSVNGKAPVRKRIPYAQRNHKRCEVTGCLKTAFQPGSRCKGHGGGRRCTYTGCDKAARVDSSIRGELFWCARHTPGGYGVMCEHPEGCAMRAVHRSGLRRCRSHGGGARCTHLDCTKAAIGSSMRCHAHNLRAVCELPGCSKKARRSSTFCLTHSRKIGSEIVILDAEHPALLLA